MKVLITNSIPEIGIQMLRDEGIEVVVMDKKKNKKKDIINALKKDSFSAMIPLLTDSIDKEVLEATGVDMQIIANYAVGFNNIDIEAASALNITVTNTPGVLTDTVAEHTVALIFAVATRIVEGDAYVRAKKFTGWEPKLLLGVDLKGKTLGVIGAGRIGTRVAEIMQTIGMKSQYFDMQKNENLEKIGVKKVESPEELLRTSDVITIHLPLNEGTHHFLNANRLSCMKKDAIVINTSRGAVIDEKALTTTLQNGEIFGAALDVFEFEPEVPNALRRLKNVIITPHIASASVETRNNMAKIVAENIIAVLHGGQAINPVTK